MYTYDANFFISNQHKIKQILIRFFTEKLTRQNEPTIKKGENEKSFEIACRIFKRGFLTKIDKEDKISIPPLYFKNENQFLGEGCFYIIDEQVFLKHNSRFREINKSNVYLFKASEAKKCWKTLIHILEAILKAKQVSQIQKIFIIGGGITLDIGSFAASILNTPYYSFPTTLLAAVDASVGGKTGINFLPYGKNQIGLFSSPQEFYIDISFFKTLPYEEFLCGLVECIKHSYIYGTFDKDKEYFDKILDKKLNEVNLNKIIEINYNYKKIIVEHDPFEMKKIRSLLNLGHTVGHILESLAELKYISPLPHGFAVGHGLLFLQKNNFIIMPEDMIRTLKLICKNNLLVCLEPLSLETILKLLEHDKKNLNRDFVQFTVPEYAFLSEPKNILSDLNEKTLNKKETASRILDFLNTCIEVNAFPS